MGERDTAIAAAVTLELFPESIREELVAERSFIGQFGLPVSTTVTFLPDGNKFSVEELYDCAVNAFEGAEGVKITEAENEAVWTVNEVDQRHGTFVLCADGNKISVGDYWPAMEAAEDRLKRFESVASQALLLSGRAKYWFAKLAARSLSCGEIIALEQDIEKSPVTVGAKIRREIYNGSSDLQTLVPVEPEFWYDAYPVSKETPSLSDFVECVVNQWVVEGQGDYGARFCAGVLRCCIHSSVAVLIDHESLTPDDWLMLADHVENEGSLFSKLGFVEAVLAQSQPDPMLLDRVSNTIDCMLAEPETGRFELLSNLFFFVSGRLSLSSVFDDMPAFVRRLVEFSHASFLEEILISEGVDANTAALDLAQRVARRAFVIGHLDAHSEARWMPEFAMPNQLKAEFIWRINNALTRKEGAFQGTPLEEFIREGSEKRISDRLKFPYSFLPGPLEGGTEQPANLPDDWKCLIETELKKDPPSLGGFNGLVNGGAVFKIPAEIISLTVAALRRVHLKIDESDDFSVGAFVDGLARIAAVFRNEQLAQEVWSLVSRVVQRKPECLEIETLFSLPVTLSAAFPEEKRDQKLCEMIELLSFGRLSKQQSAYLDACLEDLLDLRPELWPKLGKASTLIKAQKF
ncbi:MAG: hypothetical protein ACRBBS_05385 [Thalassovita sp.]